MNYKKILYRIAIITIIPCNARIWYKLYNLSSNDETLSLKVTMILEFCAVLVSPPDAYFLSRCKTCSVRGDQEHGGVGGPHLDSQVHLSRVGDGQV